jgi:hypothetical protein
VDGGQGALEVVSEMACSGLTRTRSSSGSSRAPTAYVAFSAEDTVLRTAPSHQLKSSAQVRKSSTSAHGAGGGVRYVDAFAMR